MKKIAAILPVLMLCLALQAHGRTPRVENERILDFVSRVRVDNNASAMITETIKVAVSGEGMDRGVVRTLPRAWERCGEHIEAGYRVLEVLRNGSGEPYEIVRNEAEIEIRTGREGVPLKPGIHVYTLVYRADGLVRMQRETDALAWNATGSFSLPIERADVSVELPVGARILDHGAYILNPGACGKDNGVSHYFELDRLIYRTLRPMQPGECLMIEVTWPKGWIYGRG